MRIESGHVAYAEPIEIGERIRDLASDRDGEIVLWTDSGAIVRLRPAESVDDGAALFARQCQGCHVLQVEDKPEIGPSLQGVFERRVASVEGFDYSKALLDLDGRWTRDRLMSYLADPDSVVPGTTMGFAGIQDSAARSAVVDFLKTVR